MISHTLRKTIGELFLKCVTEHAKHAVWCVDEGRWRTYVCNGLLHIFKHVLIINNTGFLAL